MSLEGKESSPADGIESAQQQHFKLASVWRRKGKLTHALKGFEKALSHDPRHVESALARGEVLQEMGRLEEAAESFREALRILPNEARLHKAFVNASEDRGDLDGPWEFYRLRGNRIPEEPFDAATLLCCTTVRNERVRLPYFLEYYREKGVEAFCFVDNGSGDQTPDYLRRQPDVFLWQSDLSFNRANFGSAWFELIMRRFGRGCWSLIVDADELLFYENAEKRSILDLCRQLEREGKRAYPALLLDMYSERAVNDTRYREGTDFRDVCGYFDRRFFHRKQIRGGPWQNMTLYSGGARRRVFGPGGGYLLSKIPLLRYDTDCVLAGGQHWTNLPLHRIANHRGCLLHFKYFGDFAARVDEEVIRGEHYGQGHQYMRYQAGLSDNGELTLFDAKESVRLQNSSQLVRLGVIVATPEEITPERLKVPRIAPIDDTPSRPFWSVMITVYDRLQFLERALSSVVNQAPADRAMQIEVLCDCPEPDFASAVGEIVQKASGGRVDLHVGSERLGQPEIFNEALRRARGRWVHILHDDDWVEDGFYRALQAGLTSGPESGAAFCRYRVDSPGHQPAELSRLERATAGVLGDWLYRIAINCRVAFSAIVVKRAACESLGGFTAEVGSAFDWEMWKRLAARYPVWFEPRPLVRCNRDGRTLTDALSASGDQVADALRAIEFSQRYLPREVSGELSRRARDYNARWALELAGRQLEARNLQGALGNLRGALDCYPSPEIRDQVCRLIQENLA